MKYFIYRYIENNTNKIVYIGKTGQLTVEMRINQHIDDKIGIWAKTHNYRVEFIELPREEDMNYLESYLIRKFSPECNTILANNEKQAPFEIHIKESLWINLDNYLKEKEENKKHLATITQKTITTNILEMKKIAEQEKDRNNPLAMTNKEDANFIKELCYRYHTDDIIITNNVVLTIYKLMGKENETITSIANRLLSYKFSENNEYNPIFINIQTDENKTQFIFNENFKKKLK